MLKYADVWRAIDRLAVKHDMSVSRLARHSGLDPTTFNISKRITKDGKRRWPSTETIAKILSATSDSMAPVYCDGDTIIVSPGADIRCRDRVVVKTRDGNVMAKELARQSARKIEFVSLTKPRRPRMLGAAKNRLDSADRLGGPVSALPSPPYSGKSTGISWLNMSICRCNMAYYLGRPY